MLSGDNSQNASWDVQSAISTKSVLQRKNCDRLRDPLHDFDDEDCTFSLNPSNANSSAY